MSDNPLMPAQVGDPNNPLTPAQWSPSTWQPGMPATSTSLDLSRLPMPTAQDIEAQRQLIYQRLRKYGYSHIPQLSDQEVISTMTRLPQPAVQWPDWVQEYFKRHPEATNPAAGRWGVDVPFNMTYEEANLKNRGLNPAVPTQVGGTYIIPREARVERYGQAAVDAEVDDWIRRGSTPGAVLDIVHRR